MSWEPVNLGKIGNREKTTPTIGGVGLVYPGKRHVFSGPQESAKTLAAYAIALDEIRRGGSVVLIDLEMGQWDARDRLVEMGATDDDLDQLHYVEPDTPATETAIAALVALPPTLVIVDAAAGAYDLQGLDDNVRRDVERFAALYVRAFWLQGIASIVIDHVVKNTDNRGKYAIGSERKTGGADVHLGFDTITPISRGTTGRFKITTHKDRHGHLKRGHLADLELHSDPITHAITWEFHLEGEEFRPTYLMERISRHLEDLAPDVRIPSGNIDTEVTGNIPAKRLGLRLLTAEGYVREEVGKHGAKLLSSVRPYRNEHPESGMDEVPLKTPTSSIENERSDAATSSNDKPHENPENVTSSNLVQTSSMPTSSIVPPL